MPGHLSLPTALAVLILTVSALVFFHRRHKLLTVWLPNELNNFPESYKATRERRRALAADEYQYQLMLMRRVDYGYEGKNADANLKQANKDFGDAFHYNIQGRRAAAARSLKSALSHLNEADIEIRRFIDVISSLKVLSFHQQAASKLLTSD